MITKMLLVFSFLLALYYPVLFALRSDPNRNSPGRAQFVFSVIVALVLGLAAMRTVLEIQLPGWVRSSIYGLIVAGLLFQDIALTKAQNKRSARIAREREDEQSCQIR